MAQSDKLPPTLGALRQHVLRVHIQARVWGQASITLQDPQLDPLQNGYHKESDGQSWELGGHLSWLVKTNHDRCPPSSKSHHRDGLDVNAKQTVLLPEVLAEQRTYPALIFASAAVSIRMMRTHRTSMKLMMTMIETICKDYVI